MTMQPADLSLAATPEDLGAPSRARRRWIHMNPLAWFVLRRVLLGVVTLVVVSIVIFAATVLLPGNAAQSILGFTATPARVHALELQLHLDEPFYAQYWDWFSGLFSGD